MAPQQQKTHILRSQLTTRMIDLANNDIIEDASPAELLSMSSYEMFYTVLQHNEQYHESIKSLISSDDDSFPNEKEFYLQFQRLVQFTLHNIRNPSLKHHTALLTSVFDTLGQAQVQQNSDATQMFKDLKRHLQVYLNSLANEASLVAATPRTLSKYFKNSSSFFHAISSPKRTSTYKNSPLFRQHEKILSNLLNFYLDSAYGTEKVPTAISQYLLSDSIFNAEMHFIDDLRFPVLGNYLSQTMIDQYRSKSKGNDTALKAIHPEEDSDLETDERPPNDIQTLIDLEEYYIPPTGKTVPSTPFPREFHENTDGLPNDPSSSSGSGTGPPPPPAPPPPPQANATPDDTTYIPDAVLARKNKDITRYMQALTTMDMTKDHMTRFSTNNEVPHPIQRMHLQRGDIRTFAGQGTLGQMYLVTFTRRNRKPIFNPVN